MFNIISTVNYMLKVNSRKKHVEVKTYLFGDDEKPSTTFSPGSEATSNDSGISDDIDGYNSTAPQRFRTSSEMSSQSDLSQGFRKMDLERTMSTNSEFSDTSQCQVMIIPLPNAFAKRVCNGALVVAVPTSTKVRLRHKYSNF